MLAARDDERYVEGVAAFTAAIGAQSLTRCGIGCRYQYLLPRRVRTPFAALGATLGGRPVDNKEHQKREESEGYDEAHQFCIGQVVRVAVPAAVRHRANGQQLFGRFAVGAYLVDAQGPEAQTVTVRSGAESGNHIVMHDLRALRIGQHTFDTHAGHDTDIMAVQHKEHQHTGVLSFAA